MRFAKQALVIAALAALGACSGSSTHVSTPPSTSTTRPAGSARIVSLVVPASVECGSATSTTVPITYAVTGAVKREITVDGLVERGSNPAQGRVVERVHCDGLEHTVALVAVDAEGRSTSEVKNFATLLRQS